MSKIFQTSRRVEFHQTDAAGIVHFAQFFLWMEQVEHEFFRHLGWSVMTRVDGRTLSWPRVAAQCDFKRPVRFEQVVHVALAVAALRRSSVVYQSRFLLEQDEVAVGRMTAVCCQLDEGGHLSATPIPAPLKQQMQLYLLPPDEGN